MHIAIFVVAARQLSKKNSVAKSLPPSKHPDCDVLLLMAQVARDVLTGNVTWTFRDSRFEPKTRKGSDGILNRANTRYFLPCNYRAK